MSGDGCHGGNSCNSADPASRSDQTWAALELRCLGVRARGNCSATGAARVLSASPKTAVTRRP